jgi:hypothetical protein
VNSGPQKRWLVGNHCIEHVERTGSVSLRMSSAQWHNQHWSVGGRQQAVGRCGTQLQTGAEPAFATNTDHTRIGFFCHKGQASREMTGKDFHAGSLCTKRCCQPAKRDIHGFR